MTLMGHLLPGTFFIVFGVWWGFGTAIRFLQSKQRSPFKKNGNEPVGYRSTVTMPCICLASKRLRRMPLESMLKLFFTAVGIAGEVYTGRQWRTYRIPLGHSSSPHVTYNTTTSTSLAPSISSGGIETTHDHDHDHHMHGRDLAANTVDDQMKYLTFHIMGIGPDYMQHITMYSAFLLGAVVEILIHYGHELPAGLDYALGAVGFTIEAFIFNSHLHGKGMVDAYFHVILVWAICGCILTGICEYVSKKNVAFTYGRCLFTILQGTWFYQVGFSTAFTPFMWEQTHENVTNASIAFCWHIMFIIIGLIIQLKIVGWCMKSKRHFIDWNDMIYIDHIQSLRASGDLKLAGQLLEEESSRRCEETLFLNPALRLDDEDFEDDGEENNDDPLNERIIFSKK